MQNFYYNSLDKKCKSVIGGIEVGKELVINVYTHSVDKCDFLLVKDGEALSAFPMRKTDFGFTYSLKFSAEGLYFYAFESGGERFGKNCRFDADENSCEFFQITAYKKGYKTPDWIKGKTIYQIFPDRYGISGKVKNPEGKRLHENWYDMPDWKPNENGEILNDDFFGGNLDGIELKVPYLKDLCIKGIYLNPITKAFSNHRYDIGDYMEIDPMLGSDEDFVNLTRNADINGIKIICDGVFNHTGDDSRYFNKYDNYPELGAYQSKKSKYAAWYKFKEYPEDYESWWGFKTLPALDKQNADFVDFITGEDGVIKKYLRLGAGGYRLDVVDELPDEFVEKIRTAVKEENPDAFLIGEVWENATDKISYGVRRRYFTGGELDSVMNYPLRSGIIDFIKHKDSRLFIETVNTMIDNFPKCSLDCLMNILGTHDTERIITVFGGEEAATREEMAVKRIPKEKMPYATDCVKKAFLLLFTVCGVPCIYYGDEHGMEGYKDPFNRKTFLSEPINKEVFDFVRRICRIRFELPQFKEGELKFEYTDDRAVIYSRTSEEGKVYIGVNTGFNEYYLDFEGEATEMITKKKYKNRYVLKPDGICILI